MSPVKAGDVLIIPEHDSAHPVKISWSQSFSSREATYFLVLAKNQSQEGTEAMIYIAEDFYNDAHLLSVGRKDGDHYLFTIDSKSQYGQKNAAGENRFVVYHDKSRKPYQHRFVDSTAQIKALSFANQVANMLGYGSAGDLVSGALKSTFGDYLHNF